MSHEANRLPAGTVLVPEHQPRVVHVPDTGPSDAVKNTLSAYLKKVEFRIDGGDDADTKFHLNEVFDEWPSQDALPYPCASIVSEADAVHDAHSFVPTPLEETFEEFAPETVLWKTAELVVPYQLDFWTNNPATRNAIEAALSSTFNVGEDRSGVMLSGDPGYFYRPVRVTLLSSRRIDTESTVYANERRLMCRLQCEVDVVELRYGRLLAPQVRLSEVGESVDLEDCQED